MKQSSILRLALFYLVLLISHEGITVATNIRQTVGLRKNIQLSTSLNITLPRGSDAPKA